MPASMLPWMVFYEHLSDGSHNVGGKRRRYIDFLLPPPPSSRKLAYKLLHLIRALSIALVGEQHARPRSPLWKLPVPQGGSNCALNDMRIYFFLCRSRTRSTTAPFVTGCFDQGSALSLTNSPTTTSSVRCRWRRHRRRGTYLSKRLSTNLYKQLRHQWANLLTAYVCLCPLFGTLFSP